MTTDLDLEKAGELSADWLELEAKLGVRPSLDLVTQPIEQIRETLRLSTLAQAQSNPPPERERLHVKDHLVQTSDGQEISVRTYRPKGLTGQELPVGVFYHGGGFVLGDIDREHPLCCSISDQAGSIVASVGYRHAPEHPYPTPVDDAYAGLLWVLDNVQDLGGHRDLVYTVGVSAGGNLATAVVRKLRDSTRGERVAAQVLRVPNCCHPRAFPECLAKPTSSYARFVDAPILSTGVMDNFWALYHVPDDRVHSLDCSPLLASEFDQFPPTYISVCGCDPLRDEGLEYAKKLEASGVQVKLDVIPGYPHGYFQWPQLSGAEEAKRMFLDAIKWAINQARSKV
ncbi:uncharacterized protein A1O9_09388 [Exophiala aquamarina CBS 119918]|uniref:Alpha/beta hydrolase fold-3 domain-containing protein n=1 Tax=Exophiala aquamarina CBS 119918 TaxID=1182545 RepID=A0A072PHD8_9EURO|nr:uncharacterized protein A1O9_09388 [Exophiala aquamarina CBS 119918]KEF54945.1 hypothetical protein A1O9_09388 [Exophiala aquamarina CBS 119918]